MKIASKVLILFLVAGLIIGAFGCGGEEAKEIEVGVIGPMSDVQGKHHLYGAQMARDEINAAGGVMVGNESYQDRKSVV
jgi:ABC-type branched-subunit amino acid transport system substrate-binding protein